MPARHVQINAITDRPTCVTCGGGLRPANRYPSTTCTQQSTDEPTRIDRQIASIAPSFQPTQKNIATTKQIIPDTHTYNNNNNNNNNNHDNIYSAVIIAEALQEHTMDTETVPCGRRPLDQANQLEPQACLQAASKPYPPSPFIIITQPES